MRAYCIDACELYASHDGQTVWTWSMTRGREVPGMTERGQQGHGATHEFAWQYYLVLVLVLRYKIYRGIHHVRVNSLWNVPIFHGIEFQRKNKGTNTESINI